MKILDTITTTDGNSYTLAQQNNGDFIITDSEGVVQELVGMAQAEAFDIFYQYDPHYDER
jgi:hypothetical protein